MRKDLRSDYYINTRRGRIVDIVTWGKLPFEFAHFTDRKPADAMMRISKAHHPQGRDRLVTNLNMQRRYDPEPNVEKVFWRGSRLDKVPLAEALWPVLQCKVTDAIQRGKPGPPCQAGLYPRLRDDGWLGASAGSACDAPAAAVKKNLSTTAAAARVSAAGGSGRRGGGGAH